MRDTTSGMRGFTANRRGQHREAKSAVSSSEALARMFEQDLARAESTLDSLQRQQADRADFDRDNQWRHDRISQLEQTLNRRWTSAVLGAARDGHPNAYGPSRLNAARADLANQFEQLGQRGSGGPTVKDPLKSLAEPRSGRPRTPVDTPATAGQPAPPAAKPPGHGTSASNPTALV